MPKPPHPLSQRTVGHWKSLWLRGPPPGGEPSHSSITSALLSFPFCFPPVRLRVRCAVCLCAGSGCSRRVASRIEATKNDRGNGWRRELGCNVRCCSGIFSPPCFLPFCHNVHMLLMTKRLADGMLVSVRSQRASGLPLKLESGCFGRHNFITSTSRAALTCDENAS